MGSAMSFTSFFEYGFFDYSVTSPHFFLIRLGLLALILYGGYRWCALSSGWSPIQALGKASLLVYWVHIDIVYGRPLTVFYQRLDISEAALQLLWLVPLMVALAWARQCGFVRILRSAGTVFRRRVILPAARS
jgi:hypothetical protein